MTPREFARANGLDEEERRHALAMTAMEGEQMAHKTRRPKTAEVLAPTAAPGAQTPGPSAPSQDWRRAPATGVPWMQRYLIAREAADSDDDAVRLARVSVPIVLREAARNPEFAALRQQAITRTLTLGNEDSTRLARDGYPSLLQHAITRATSPEVRDRDQATWTSASASPNRSPRARTTSITRGSARCIVYAPGPF